MQTIKNKDGEGNGAQNLADLNKLLDKEINETVGKQNSSISDQSFKLIEKYAELLLQNDDKFMAKKRF